MVLAASLPAFEALKNVAWLAFAIVWIWNSVRSRHRLVPAGAADVVFATFLGACLLSVGLAHPWPGNWSESVDVLRYIGLAWLLARTRIALRDAILVLAVAAVATVATALHGFWAWKIVETAKFLELKSVGHVNHSAIYMVTVALAAFAASLAAWRDARPWRRFFAPIVCALMAWLILIGESRAAALTLVASVPIILLIYARRAGLRIWRVLGAVAVFASIALLTQPHLILKTQTRLESGLLYSFRPQLMQTAVEAWRQEPLLGVGAGNFGLVQSTQVQAWVERRGERFEAGRYYFSTHGHSLYFNTLAERGLIGLAALALLLGFWIRTLVVELPVRNSPSAWIVWGAACSSLLVVTISGALNTTLHHEHGLLAMLALGVLLGARTAMREA